MPIYEYSCPKCGEFEVTQRITENPLKKCPTCKSKVRKLISNTSFQLKGSGWYVTDYAGKKSAGKDTESGTSSSDDSAKSTSTDKSTSTESKPSASTESKSKDAPTTSKKDSSAKAA